MSAFQLFAMLPDGETKAVGYIVQHGPSIEVEADDSFYPGASGYYRPDDLPSALADALPDSFGASVIAAALGRRPSTPLELLLHTSDDFRLGALRLRDRNGLWVGTGDLEPSHNALETAFTAIRALGQGRPLDRAVIAMLAGVSGSAGGARPKIMTRLDDEREVIVKFPKDTDTLNVSVAEKQALHLHERAGGVSAQCDLKSLPGTRHHALIVERFDRTDLGRVPMISGRTAAALLDPREAGESNAAWEERISYEHLALFLWEHGATSQQDVEKLYRLAVFNAAIGNTDNHLKNHAFLWSPEGWHLSPAYDVVPQPERLAHKLAFYFDSGDAVIRLETKAQALEFARRLDISSQTAQDILELVDAVIQDSKPDITESPSP